MRVLALTSSYPRFEGDPTAPFIESITRRLAERGHTTDLVLPAHADWNRPPGDDGIRYHPCRYSPWRSWTPWGFSGALEEGVKIRRPLYLLAPLVALSMLRCSTKLAKQAGVDLVHAHWVIPNGPIAATVAARHGLPLVISLHGSDVSVSERSSWIRRVARRSFERAAAVTAPSEDLLERARALGARGALEVIPYGGDAEAFRVDPSTASAVRARLGVRDEEVLVLGIGRFLRVKGFNDLVEAVRRARSGGVSARLVLVGDGDLREELRAQVRNAGLDEQVTFAGMAGRLEVPEYFAAADIVAVPSVRHEGLVDGLPNVALEAMAAAKPVIATRIGGLPQVVHDGENGLLVDERAPHALALAISRLAADESMRRQLGEHGRSLVEGPLSWGTTAKRFDALYRRVAAGGPDARA